MKVIGIIRNNCVTGIEYGLIEIGDAVTYRSKKETQHREKTTKNNKKHVSAKNTHSKVVNTEKETKTAKKATKTKYRIRTTITLSYHYYPTKKTADTSKKRFQKAKTLFKKKQRLNKIALQNVMQHVKDIVLSDLMAAEINKQR